MKTVRRPPYPKWNPGYFPCSSLTPPSAFLKPSFGGFGLSHTSFQLSGGRVQRGNALGACPCILWVGGVSDRSCPWSKETVAQRGRHTLSSPEPEQLPAPTSRGRIGKAGPE